MGRRRNFRRSCVVLNLRRPHKGALPVMTRPWRSIHFLTVLSLPIFLLVLASPAALASAAPSPQAQQRGGQPVQQRGGQPSAAPERWVQNFENTEQWSGPDEGA